MENLNKDSSVKEYKNVYDKRIDKDLEEISRIITMAIEQKKMLLYMHFGESKEPNILKEIKTEPEDTWILKKSTGREEYYGAKYFKLVRRKDSPKKEDLGLDFSEAILKIHPKQTEKKEYKIIYFCSFYAGGDADGDCQLYGSGGMTKSRKCKDIYCQYKASVGEKEATISGLGGVECSSGKSTMITSSKPPEYICTLREQGECGNEGSMDCLKGNSKGERFDTDVCVHGKRELEKIPEPMFVCKECGKNVFGIFGKLKGSYYCTDCNPDIGFKTEPEKPANWNQGYSSGYNQAKKELTEDFLEKIDGAIKYYHPNPKYLMKLRKEYEED